MLTLNPVAFAYFWDGHQIMFRPVEMDIFEYMLAKLGQTCTNAELRALLPRAWGETASDKTIQVHMSNMRKRLEATKYHIVTYDRRGYTLKMEG